MRFSEFEKLENADFHVLEPELFPLKKISDASDALVGRV
jgi:hypothetical protein